MKKAITVFSALAILAVSTIHAESTSDPAPAPRVYPASEDSGFAWGIGLGALAVIGAVVGVVVSTASQTHSTPQPAQQ